jgi:branched-subunit amino acid transport protein
MSTAIAVLLVAAGSFVLRFAPLVVDPRLVDSPRVQRMASLAGTAAVSALIAGAVLHQPTSATPAGAVSVLTALAVGALVAARGRELIAVVAAGLGAYWAVTLAAMAAMAAAGG